MEMITNALMWFEIPVIDFERAKKFYSKIYDYEMSLMEVEDTLMGILPHDQEKGVGGAIIKTEGMVPNPSGTRVYLNGGKDLNTILDRVEGAGGKLIIPKTPVGSDGFYALFEDTEGNHVGLYSM